MFSRMKKLLSIFVNYLANSAQPDSLSHQARKKRWDVFQRIFGAMLNPSYALLDVGVDSKFLGDDGICRAPYFVQYSLQAYGN